MLSGYSAYHQWIIITAEDTHTLIYPLPYETASNQAVTWALFKPTHTSPIPGRTTSCHVTRLRSARPITSFAASSLSMRSWELSTYKIEGRFRDFEKLSGVFLVSHSLPRSVCLLEQSLLPHSESRSHPAKPFLRPQSSLCLSSSLKRFWSSMEASETSNGTTLRNAFGNVLSFFILVLIGVLAFSIRLFSVSSMINIYSSIFLDLIVIYYSNSLLLVSLPWKFR